MVTSSEIHSEKLITIQMVYDKWHMNFQWPMTDRWHLYSYQWIHQHSLLPLVCKHVCTAAVPFPGTLTGGASKIPTEVPSKRKEEKRTNNKHVYTRVPRAVWYVWCRVQCMVCGVCGVMYAMRVAETRIETYTHADVTFFFPFCLPPSSFPPSSSSLSPPSSSYFLRLPPSVSFFIL